MNLVKTNNQKQRYEMYETQIQIQPFLFPTLIISLLLLWIIKKTFPKPTKNPPPSPPKLPILGNLHQLGPLLHQNLRLLARKHGPIMLLRFGSVPVLIISSADWAREAMRTHDLIFASRPLSRANSKLLYDGRDVLFAPYGEKWRRAKTAFVLQLLSTKRVHSFRSIREEETALLVKKVLECSGPVNLSKMFSELSYDGICRSAFGKKYSMSEKGKKFPVLVRDLSEVVGAVCIGEFIPWLRWINRFSGFDEKVDRLARDLDEFLEGVILERLENKEEPLKEENGVNFLDILLEIHSESRDEVSIDMDTIKALILNVFVAGTDTTSIVLEWAMAELFRHPLVMEKLQNEVRAIAQENRDITEYDLERMQYMKAVIKETLRYHPPAPLLVPRVASKDVRIKGYDVPAGALVLINAWAIGRDPVSWDEPEKFKPERFLNSSLDFKGSNFEFIPFGAGRRVCPGITFAVATMELVLANLVQKFEWKLPNGVEGNDLDMSEGPGITVPRDFPLLAVASLSR